ncbi:putative quinol monooxygenase [Sediminitomix flava]|uniref:Quinol monooxygenase YgiN n=1 Tax=Sediminitomix flava TaxID=379075 RepID=A0A316A3E4_SEDFL|nr:antibiotic biosynthesis monooxygenase family protein [Sediminitomix flava]PWJ44247.1 quinol monooxygenase YgiN [Sediminitomix flava]
MKITRIVRMYFKEEERANFLAIFQEKQTKISGFEGCLDVNLYADLAVPNVCTTISIWESAEALEAYRNSELFITTWKRVKPLFSQKAEAVSYVLQD